MKPKLWLALVIFDLGAWIERLGAQDKGHRMFMRWRQGKEREQLRQAFNQQKKELDINE